MKTSKAIILVMAALALSAAPALAQRNGGSRSVSSSRGSVSSPSRSVSSSPSRSMSSSPSRSMSATPSRSSSFNSSPSRSMSSSRSTSSSSSRSSSFGSSPSRSVSAGTSPSRSVSAGSSRSASVSSPRSTSVSRSHSVEAPTGTMRSTSVRPSPRGDMAGAGRSQSAPVSAKGSSSAAGMSSHSTPIHSNPSANPGARSGGYARPGRHGGYMPPASRPIHPAPYFHHPWYGHRVHCHPVYWDPLPLRPLFWPGFWLYCNSYWYDYHVTDVVVVRDYVKETYSVDMVTYGISGDIMYAIVKDGGDTFLQVYDKEDHLLGEQRINKKYCNMVIDAENGGCWITKKNDKDPLLFIWVPEEAKLLIYEED